MWPVATPVKSKLTSSKLSAMPSTPPRGREEIKDAVLDAAERLFAQSGPAAISLRDIATEAGVTYSLISRHFGTRDDLLEAILVRYAERWKERAEGHVDFNDAVKDLLGGSPESAYMRLLAWSLLTGQGETAHGTASLLDQIVPLASGEADRGREATARTATALSLIFGWKFFAPFIVEALHMTPAEARAFHRGLASAVSHVWV